MSQIEITIFNEVQYPNVISCSFFTMTDSYRSFEKYKANLATFITYTHKLTDFEVRIYTDDTGIEYAKTFIGSHVSVYHFNCPEFREGTGHTGTFGTLVRFLPLFEDHQTVWISDIDIPQHWLTKPPSGDIDGYTMLCYDRKVYARKYTLGAGRFISRVQFPRAMLTRFLNRVSKGDFDSVVDALNKQNKRKPQSKFPYGMDEVFLNSSMYDWIKRANLNMVILIDYIPALITHFVTAKEKATIEHYYKTNNQSLVPKLKEIFKKKIPPILDQYPCLDPLMKELASLKSFTKDIQIKTSNL